MKKTVLTTHTFKPTVDLRKSLALLLFGVVALFASLSLEHNRHIHQGLSGQLETTPIADIALLLHKESALERSSNAIASSHSEGKDDKDKASSFWLALIKVDLTLYGSLASHFIHASSILFYCSPRTQTYSPRAPPRI